MTDKNLFNFKQRLFIGSGNQFQITQTISSIFGQPDFIDKTGLAIFAHKSVGRTAEISFVLRISYFVLRIAVYAVTQNRLEADFFEQTKLK